MTRKFWVAEWHDPIYIFTLIVTILNGVTFWGGLGGGEGNDNPLQYSCLENPMDWEAW